MKNHLAAYLTSLIPQIGLSEQEFNNALGWLQDNYDQWYNACRQPEYMNAAFMVIEKHPDDLVAILMYCDICYEYNLKTRIDQLTSNKQFQQGSEIITDYFILRDRFKKNGGDELAHWSAYIMYISEKYKKK